MNAPCRIREYRKKWIELTDMYGNLCFYCKKEIATSIDHVIPYSYDQVSDLDNLVPACLCCNATAGGKIFSDVEEKRQYILAQRAKHPNKIVICNDCLLPYSYRIHSPSLFLCAECYDEEYGDVYSKRKEWGKWIKQLWAAGIPAEAHRNMKHKLHNVSRKEKDHRVRTDYLIDQYFQIMNSDSDFVSRLVNS